MIEASPSAYPSGRLALGTTLTHEEETCYVGADVKRFFSSLQPRPFLLLSIGNEFCELWLC
jgi:hypothetical protein